MNGDRIDSAPLLDVWIERTLEFTDEMEPHVRQQEILRRLDDVQFHPGFYEASALQGFFDQELSSIAKWHACERLLREDIVDFRRVFLDLSIEDRNARYQKLMTDAEYFPVLKHVLSQMQVGLEIEKDAFHGMSPEAESFGRFLLGQLCEDPHRIAAMRREYEQTHAWDQAQWKSTIREIREKAPEILTIDRKWITRLENPPKPNKKLARIGQTGQQKESSGKSGWVIAIVIFIALRFFSVIDRFSNDETDTYKYTRAPTVEEPQFDADKMREILESVNVPKTTPPVIIPEEDALQDERKRLQQHDALAELKEYQFERFDDAPFKIVKETGLLYIVFDQEQYLAEMALLSNLPNPRETRLYELRQREYALFQDAVHLVRLLQSEVYVTYIGMDPTKRRPPPKGTILRPMLSGSSITDQPLSEVIIPEENWRELYRVEVQPAEEVNGE